MLLSFHNFVSSEIAALAGWVKERNPTMGNDNFIVGYCVPTQA